MRLLTLTVSVLALTWAGLASAQMTDPKIAARVAKVLATTPLIDGHNDLLGEILGRAVMWENSSRSSSLPMVRSW